MNNIDELIKIIERLGGSATLEEIVEVVQKEYRMVIFSNHKKTIESTLLSYPDVVRHKNGVFVVGDTKGEEKSIPVNSNSRALAKSALSDIYHSGLSDYSDVKLDINRGEIRCKSIQMINRKSGFCVYFNNSHIHNQSQLNYLTRTCKVSVHYGSAKKYQKITWDVSECVSVNNTNLADLSFGYFGCERLDRETAIEIYRYLMEINDCE